MTGSAPPRRPLIWLLALVLPGLLLQGSATPPAEEVVPSGDGVVLPLPADVYPHDYLYDYIDGGAPQYIEYGFEEVASQELTYQGRTYIFDIYRMTSPLGAWGIFSTRRPLDAQPLEGFPFSSFTPYQGLVAHGPYHFDISAYAATDTTAGDMAHLAWLAASRIDAALVPGDLLAAPPFTRLPGAGRLPGSERLARGPISLRAALTGAGDDLFREAIDAALLALEAVAQRSATPSADAPWWVVSGYHPLEDDTGSLTPQTTLAVLVTHDPVPALRAAGAALAEHTAHAEPALRELPGDRGWIWEGGAVMQRGGELILATTTQEADRFRTWVEELLAP